MATLGASEFFLLSKAHAWILGKQRPLLLNSFYDSSEGNGSLGGSVYRLIAPAPLGNLNF